MVIVKGPRKHAPSPLTLATHGLGFIKSSVDLLSDDDPSEQQSREVVVLLAVGVELLLKSRLLSEHWSLVFEDVDSARESNLIDGKLKSVGPEDCLNRLRYICGEKISTDTEDRFKKFWEFRNRVVHFADRKLSAASLRSQAHLVLSELVDLTTRQDFVPSEVAPRLDELRRALMSMTSYVELRRQALEDALHQAGDASFYCTSCDQRAFVMQEGSGVCLFCRLDYDHYSEIASLHLEREHGYSWHDPRADGAIAHCLACEAWGGVVLERQHSPVMRCLQCWATTDRSELLRCMPCNHWHAPASRSGPYACLDCQRPLDKST
jgi:hypothetical protein